ncbi:MAG: VWA domain-containing protein, partial [Candidatus Krumholzibacteriia bacterium]
PAARHAPAATTRVPAVVAAAAAAAARGDVARKPFGEAWSPAESRRLAEELVRLLARLRLRPARRRRRARRGALWVQRVVRANVGHDGVPLRLVRRAPSRREPRLLLLVDVSHSVRRAAAAFMTVVAGLARAFRAVRVICFVDQPVELTPILPRLARLGGSAAALADVARGVPELNDLALSDYGRVLDRLARETAPRLRSNTLVLVLGDARTNRLDPQAWALEALRARARRVVWLVPERIEQWDTGDSALAAYAPHCDLLVEAADLAGLAHGLRRALAL